MKEKPIRKRTFYAFLPVTAGGETRWLETVTVLEMKSYTGVWQKIRFADDYGLENNYE